ncbi:MAG TPA: hypothetical protein VFX37_03060 [Pseudolabrys sp.]|nr:hypothetical protein [Pseudolabrys sp.]
MRLVGEYLRKITALAAQSSWKALNGVEGAGLGGVAAIILGVLAPAQGNSLRATIENWLINFVICTLIAWAGLFVVRLILVAPFQLWVGEQKRLNVLAADTITLGQDKKIEHDKTLATKFRTIFPEPSKQKITSDLLNQHAYWDIQSNQLADAIVYLDSAEAHFLLEELQLHAKAFVQATASLLEFLGYKFFVHPRDQRKPPIYFAMQPSLNVDREGDGSLEQMQKYDKLTEDLEGLVAAMSNTYDALIRAFHEKLFV